MAGPELEIVEMRPRDWDRVAEIFAEGIATGDSTFETEVPTWERWDADHLPEPRLVARLGDRVVGWGAANRTSIRRVYRGVAEVSVYVAEEARGEGVGQPLLTALAEAAHDAGLWTLEAIVIDGNTASARMVEACGFRLVGRRERLGELRGRWRDVLLYERRRPRD
ncbi:MAG TPA: GNAT family N-acetyltransferase [Miltoncostaeaceae bacterium]|jgi:phosphinothricin acetyltransferase|nr:GNAT family N-acetyltransferase [Miltoncostaeaceae bacterium]